jgi:hypothetical protein
MGTGRPGPPETPAPSNESRVKLLPSVLTSPQSVLATINVCPRTAVVDQQQRVDLLIERQCYAETAS